MAIFNTSQAATANVNVIGKTTPVISNIVLLTAGTEYEVDITPGCREFTLQARGDSKLQLAYVSGDSGTTYLSVWPGNSYQETTLNTVSITLYIQATKDNEILEIIAWT